MKKLFTMALLLATSSLTFAQEQSAAHRFFQQIKNHCGMSYQGKVTAGAKDDDFSKNTLVMHVRSCSDHQIRIPFLVGEDRSRTWVLTLENNRILLKHDHRHPDGSEDKVTQYGGWTPNVGSDTLQMFPADTFTSELIPYAAANVWWITINEKEFTYNLHRIGSDRVFTVTFDLTRTVSTPPAPWGWKE